MYNICKNLDWRKHIERFIEKKLSLIIFRRFGRRQINISLTSQVILMSMVVLFYIETTVGFFFIWWYLNTKLLFYASFYADCCAIYCTFTIKNNIYSRLKNKIENNSTWEGAFYQSEWVKINWSWVILVFSRYVCCCYCIRIV